MTEFKVGDKVRIKGEGLATHYPGERVIDSIETEGYAARVWPYRIIGERGAGLFKASELEKVEPEPEYKSGDRVRVTFEAQFHDETEDWVQCVGASVWKTWDDVDILNVEKVEPPEPPVETFKPGDTVRSKRYGMVYTIGKDGYLSHVDGIWVPTPVEFTSKKYEKVNLAEVPF